MIEALKQSKLNPHPVGKSQRKSSHTLGSEGSGSSPATNVAKSKIRKVSGNVNPIRRGRLPTITSDVQNEENTSDHQPYNRRRKSSDFGMIFNDPKRYHDEVRQFLDQVEEDEGEGEAAPSKRKRTRSFADLQQNKGLD
jgi:hypothetical protein